ncbi:Larp4b [Symbiodinium sp. CCMP2592]|nr:Larp4b [Symbiodinium sp. CCMP2592]
MSNSRLILPSPELFSVLPSSVVRLTLLVSIWPWLSFGKGNQDCFRGQPGLSYEACCQEKWQPELCWGVDAEFVGEYCCEHDVRPVFEARLWNLLGQVIVEVLFAVDCELITWQDGSPDKCEKALLAKLVQLDIVDYEWVHNVWLPSMHRRSGRTSVERLHFAMLLCQTFLHSRTASVVQAFKGDFLTSFRVSHAAGTDELRRISLEATGKSWARQLAVLRSAPRDLGVVHVALVASVGEPVFAFKAMATIRSALFFARRKRLHFHLFVDTPGERAMRYCLDELRQREPILASRAAAFELYGEDVLRHFFKLLRANIVPGCLGQTKLYGDSGWIRLFVHELLRNRPEVDLLVFVDAGDYVFLEDVSRLLVQRRQWRVSQVGGNPRDAEGPFQVLDLPRMRRHNFTKILSNTVRKNFESAPETFCEVGEGATIDQFALNATLWHVMEEPWVVEAREHGGVQLRGGGVTNFWDEEVDGAIWRDRVYPGFFDWTVLRVHCPLFLESFLATTLQGRLPPSRAQYKFLGWMVTWYHRGSVGNWTLEESGLLNDRFKHRRCNEKAWGVHFTSGLKSVPWARNFMNFWAGATQLGRDGPWGKDERDWTKRSLTFAAKLRGHDEATPSHGAKIKGALAR